MSTTDESSITNVTDTISTALDASDEQTAQRLETLGLVHQARVAQLTRYATLVNAHYGAGSPQSTEAQAAVTASQTVAARTEVVSRQLNTAPPAIPAGGWLLHGRVYDAQASAVAKQTVFLVDAQRAFQPAYGFAYTDDTGYFVLTAQATTAVTEGEGGEADPSAPATPPELYVEVTNEKRQPVYLGSSPLEPAAATAAYVNIYLAPGGKSIGAPPRALRGSALPKAPRKSAK
jgi:hypothetical protein